MLADRMTRGDAPAMDRLCTRLAEMAPHPDDLGWPARQLALLAAAGVFEWFLPADWGGQGWSESQLVQAYLRLGQACLTTSFILTQRTAACTRLVNSTNPRWRAEWAAGLRDGSKMVTVAISHLATSRQHLGQPALRATPNGGGYRLDGYSAWVTGAAHADLIVTGATVPDGRQILVALDPQLPGVVVPAPERLVALSASCTGRLECTDVAIPAECVVAGPADDVMRVAGGGTGGLQTSALAGGLADAAIGYLEREASRRGELAPIAAALRGEWRAFCDDLMAVAAGVSPCSRDDVRSRGNSLVLRATQAALGAAKGTGYVESHPVGRWCREALFFLVWSCPQTVLATNLCELAMLESSDRRRAGNG